ncbi:MAG TPA: CPBP family intramembrane glutamic endopeptidase, partial [Anaerolineae bacterium]|nr:CPBP family intramembrane glutamic endopeptidase [Anaerolineae bacterium]
AITWSIMLPLVASAQGWLQAPVPFALHYLAAFGPMLAALIMTWATGGAAGLKELWGRVTKWRVGLTGAAFAILSPVVLFVLAAIVVRALGGEWPDLQRLGEVNYLPNLGIGALVLWLATYGFGEEIGWRGFALPRLQKSRSALSATLILGVMWIVWHMPAFFYLDTYVALGLAAFPLFALGVMTGAIVLTWLYNTTGGSVLMVAVWHGVFDFLSASKANDGTIAALMSAAIMVWAVVIVIVFKPANLARHEKHTL